MTVLAIHDDQGKARAASGGLACGMGKPAPIAGRHKFQPAESKAAGLRPGAVAYSKPGRSFIELRGGRFSHRAGLLSSSRQGRPVFLRGWIGACDDVADSFRLRAAGLRDEQIAAAMSPVLPADQTVTIEPGLLQPIAEPAHAERPSKSTVAMSKRDRKGVGSVQKSVGVFQHVGS